MRAIRGFIPYHFSKKSGKGFTLIELLVVIAIIGMLSSVVLASLNSARAKARDARRLSDLHQIMNALQLYSSDNSGDFPPGPNYRVYVDLQSLSPAYISKVPRDPVYGTDESTTNDYAYCSGADGLTLMAFIETKNNWCRKVYGSSACWSDRPFC